MQEFSHPAPIIIKLTSKNGGFDQLHQLINLHQEIYRHFQLPTKK